MEKERTIGTVFWDNVREEMNEIEYTYKDLDIMAGLSMNYCAASVCKGTLPNGKIIEKIADALEVDYYVLFIDEISHTY